MIAYITFLLLFSILIWPISFIVALLVKLSHIGRMSREMYPGADAIMDMVSSENYHREAPTEESSISSAPSNKQKPKRSPQGNRFRRTRIENTIIAVASVVISAILSFIAMSKL